MVSLFVYINKNVCEIVLNKFTEQFIRQVPAVFSKWINSVKKTLKRPLTSDCNSY